MESENNNLAVIAEPEDLIGIIPSLKQGIKQFVGNLLQRMDDGELDPLEIHVKLIKTMEKIAKEVSESEGYKKAVRNSAEAYGKEFQRFGATIKLSEAGTEYDYSNCGHIYYENVCQKIESLKKDKKKYETELKAIKTSKEFIFNEEKHTVYPPVKSSTSSVTVTF